MRLLSVAAREASIWITGSVVLVAGSGGGGVAVCKGMGAGEGALTSAGVGIGVGMTLGGGLGTGVFIVLRLEGCITVCEGGRPGVDGPGLGLNEGWMGYLYVGVWGTCGSRTTKSVTSKM